MGKYFSLYLTGKTATKFKRIKNRGKYITRLIAQNIELRKILKESIQCPVCESFVSFTESGVPYIKEAG